MKRMVLHPVTPQKRLVKKAAEVFDQGGIVVYPTGAGYSMGCSVLHKKSINRLYHLKRAIKKYYMAIMVAEFSSITEFANIDTPTYRYIKDRLPGPYTFILPATKHGKKILDVKRKEVGIRMPDHAFCETLNEFYKDPLVTTAAKINDTDYFVDPDDIEAQFGKSIDLFVDMGPVPVMPTTIISLVNGEPELVRAGSGEFSK